LGEAHIRNNPANAIDQLGLDHFEYIREEAIAQIRRTRGLNAYTGATETKNAYPKAKEIWVTVNKRI